MKMDSIRKIMERGMNLWYDILIFLLIWLRNESINRVVDTGAGFLLRTGESKARERRFFQPKEFEEEMCLDCQLPFRNSELR